MPIEKIIVLEDDLVVRKNLEQQLRYKRYDVASATTIAEAQELLTKDNFDLMVVDVRLPDGKGTDLLKQLQTRPVKPLVVMISGMGTVELAVECMSNGAFTFLTKPFSTEQLAVTLKKAEDHPQLGKSSAIEKWRPVKPLVVMISGMGTVELAVECMSNGAFTFLTKPEIITTK